MEAKQSRGRRTWSAFGDIRRIPSEYEVVTHDADYTMRKGRASALESNPTSPMNLWLLTYRDKSPLFAEEWNGFRDPDEMTYKRYVTMQDDQQQVVDSLFEDYAAAGHDRKHQPGWRAALRALFTPTRYPAHAFQMMQSYLAQIAPSSYIINCAALAAADLLRRTTVVAYRTRELSKSWPGEGFAEGERATWEDHPGWQASRKALELALMTYDWGECFTAANLVLRPTIDDVLVRQLGEVARENGDEQTWLLMTSLKLDVARSHRWSAALGRHAVKARPDNAAVLRKWIDRWAPRADEAVEGLAGLLQALPEHGRPAAETVRAARAARDSVLAEAGLGRAS